MKFSSTCFYNDGQRHVNLWWQGTFFLTVLLAINVLLFLLDQRLLGDEALWLKPIKFEISVIIHFVTLSVLAALLSAVRRNTNQWRVMSFLVVAAGLFEVLYIFLQAARGRESHFNSTTAIESAMYGLMGLGALLLVLGSFYLGCLLFREYQSERSNVLLLSSAFGLMVGSVLTFIIAGYLSSSDAGYIVKSSADTLRFPIFSWYLNGHDLRIPHFLATHMMQIIPLYGLWLKQSRVPIAACKKRLFFVIGIYSLIVLALFFLAIYLK